MGKIKAYKSSNKDYRLPLSPRIFRLLHSLRNDESAFTVVELVIVIVVIAVLAAITIVGYRGISKQTTESVMKGDLGNSFKALENFKTLNDTYPSTIDCSKSESSTNLCLQNNSKDITFTYVPSSDLKTYQLCTTSANLKENYCVSNSKNIPTITADADLPKVTVAESCPTGYILVPGSTTYGTSDFCVAKYEMKIYGNDTGTTGYSSTNYPSSRASGTPYVSISQTNAIAMAQKTVDQSGNTISGAHLITEAEWMTIAQNILGVASNWSTGTVGSGFVYTGHNYNNPASALSASDNNAASNYGETSYDNASVTSNNKRTLTLSNGEVIWDLSGNVYEWTSGTVTGTQPTDGSTTTGSWLQWNAITSIGSLIINPTPTGTGISGANSWTSAKGIGAVYTWGSGKTTTTYAFERSSCWECGANGGTNAEGVLLLFIGNGTTSSSIGYGFRVVVPAS